MARRSRKRLAKTLTIQNRAIVSEDYSLPPKAIRALEAQLQGTVVMPGDPTYNTDRQLWNPAFQSFPQIIVYCEVFNDIRLCLKFAHKHKLKVTCRSGGHSTAGYSVNDGMVIDTSRMSYVVVDPDPAKKQVIVGAGTAFARLNAILNEYGLHLPSGACEDVCVAGFMQGGGYGVTSREFGINCDNVLEVLVMLWDGRIVTANKTCNPDLFWAIRGGTGNNFGVLLQVVYKVYELGDLWGFQLQWPLEEAAPVLVKMQERYMGDEWPKLGYMVTITYREEKPILLMSGVYNGSKAEGLAALHELLPDQKYLIDQRSGSYAKLDQWLFSGPYDLPVTPAVAREDKDSRYIIKRLTQAEWQQVIDHFLASPNQLSAIVFEPYGGVINHYPLGREGNAFIHRDVYMNFFADVFWLTEEEHQAVIPWLDQLMDLIAPFSNGRAYQNYPRRSNKNYRSMYWGNFFNSLLAIKQKYDPHNFFHYPQSISPVPEEAGEEIEIDTSEPIFPETRINYRRL